MRKLYDLDHVLRLNEFEFNKIIRPVKDFDSKFSKFEKL